MLKQLTTRTNIYAVVCIRDVWAHHFEKIKIASSSSSSSSSRAHEAGVSVAVRSAFGSKPSNPLCTRSILLCVFPGSPTRNSAKIEDEKSAPDMFPTERASRSRCRHYYCCTTSTVLISRRVGVTMPPVACIGGMPRVLLSTDTLLSHGYSSSWVSCGRTKKNKNCCRNLTILFYSHGPTMCLHTELDQL